MSTFGFKNSITSIPTYLDGSAAVYIITQTEDVYPVEIIVPVLFYGKEIRIPFEEISLTDRTKYEFESRSKKITMKIRISQTKEMSSKHALKIGDKFHRVFNAFHFKNKDGYAQTDLTLEEYPNPTLRSDSNDQG